MGNFKSIQINKIKCGIPSPSFQEKQHCKGERGLKELLFLIEKREGVPNILLIVDLGWGIKISVFGLEQGKQSRL